MGHKFLITGCARSGTGYIATLLTALGIPCGHERVFCPTHLRKGEDLLWPDQVWGESSWLAAPYIDALPLDLPVLHQVREPTAFVRSKVRTRFFEVPTWYKSFAERVAPDLLEGTSVERSMRYWITWNRMVAAAGNAHGRPYLRYRLEDIDAPLLRQIFELIGVEVPNDHLDAVLAKHPRNYNTRGRKDRDGDLRFDSLPAGDLRDEMAELATEFGYGEVTPQGTLALH